MTSGIRRSIVRNNGDVHYWYRYPVTDLWGGEYCPLCLEKNEMPENHHIVSRSETISTIGYAQHWHNNIINICATCHKKITSGQASDSNLIYKREFYFVSAVHGLRTWMHRNALRKVCEQAVKIKTERKESYPDYEWDWGYAFLSYVHSQSNYLKYYSRAHYRASFVSGLKERINSLETPLFFLTGDEMFELIKQDCPDVE